VVFHLYSCHDKETSSTTVSTTETICTMVSGCPSHCAPDIWAWLPKTETTQHRTRKPTFSRSLYRFWSSPRKTLFLNGVQILASKYPRMQNTRLIHRPRRSITHLINTPPMILPEEVSARYTSILFGRLGVIWFPFCGSFPSPMEDEPVLSEATRLDSR